MLYDIIIKNRYAIKNLDKSLLGSGSYGSVYYGIDLETKTKVAIKIIMNRGDNDPTNRGDNDPTNRAATREIEGFKSMKCHQNVVCLVDYIKRNSTSYIIMEYVKGSSFEVNPMWDPNTKRVYTFNVFTQLVYGLNYIHSQGLIHMDIKNDNIIIEKDKISKNHTGKVKIVDLGFVCERNNCGIGGTIPYRDPYMAITYRSDYFELDIYSLGITLFVALNGEDYFPPDFNLSNKQFITDILNNWASAEINQYFYPINKWVLQMTDPNPNKRPDTFDIINAINTSWPETIPVRAKSINIIIDKERLLQNPYINYGRDFGEQSIEPKKESEEEKEESKEEKKEEEEEEKKEDENWFNMF